LPGAAASLANTAGGARGPVAKFKAPLLDRILTTAGDPERRVIALDFGGPCQSLLEKLSLTRPCRVEVADFARSGGLKALEELESLEEEGPKAIRRLLPPAGEDRLDLIFLWDLPNYLSLDELKLLIDVLADRIAPRCRLHMLIAYSKREIAARPSRYQTDSDGNLIQIPENDRLAEVPRHTQEDLAQAMGKFTYERGVLLTNGMQELVYQWPPEKRGDGRPF
jgi:hypothetical protein